MIVLASAIRPSAMAAGTSSSAMRSTVIDCSSMPSAWRSVKVRPLAR